MATITADLVKQLRERTGAGMMECKKALVETAGDIEAAAELMRKTGLAKADKKAARIAAEGVIAVEKAADGKSAAMVEVNCETDFVARESDFQAFAGERHRGVFLEAAGQVGAYRHGTRIGALVALEAGEAALGHDLAMHVAAANPQYLSTDDVPPDVMAKEREIETAKAKGEGKPAEIVAKMVEGRLRKSLGEITLLGQPFVKDPDQSVEKLLKAAKASVRSFQRFEVGAGIEKKQDDFVGEVMAQVKASSGGSGAK
jgi:elongation factor Ts